MENELENKAKETIIEAASVVVNEFFSGARRSTVMHRGMGALQKALEVLADERLETADFCPVCGDCTDAIERRPNGNSRCSNGHIYPSRVLPIAGGGDE